VEARFVDSDEALGAVATLSEGERVVARARGSFALIG
jgi:hypothetical protein